MDRRGRVLGRLWEVLERLDDGDSLFDEYGLDVSMVFTFGVATGAAAPRRLALLFVFDHNWSWERRDPCDDHGFCEECWGDVWHHLGIRRRDLATSVSRDELPPILFTEFEDLRYRLTFWPQPAAVWICGERVGTLWPEVYATEPERRMRADARREAWRFVRGLARHKARRAIDLAGLAVLGATFDREDWQAQEVAHEDWEDLRRRFRGKEWWLTVERQPARWYVPHWSALIDELAGVLDWANEEIFHGPGSAGPANDTNQRLEALQRTLEEYIAQIRLLRRELTGKPIDPVRVSLPVPDPAPLPESAREPYVQMLRVSRDAIRAIQRVASVEARTGPRGD